MRFLLLFAACAALDLAGQNVRARASLDTARMSPGDHNSLIISVLAPSEAAIDSVKIGNLEAVVGAENILERGDWAFGEGLRKMRILFTAFDSGRFEIRPVEVFFSDKTSGEVGSAATNSTAFEVMPFSVADTATLAPIKPILREPSSIWDHLPMFLAILAVIAAAVALYFFIEKPLKKAQKSPEKSPELRPWERALRQLEELERREIWQKGQPKLFHELLNGTLREYLAARFGLRATRMTTAEIVAALPASGLAEGAVGELEATLKTVDLVKFAEAQPPDFFHPEALEKARGLIRSTVPERAAFSSQLIDNERVTIGKGDDLLRPKTAFSRRTLAEKSLEMQQKIGPEFAIPSRRLAAGAVDLAVWLGGLVVALRLAWAAATALGLDDDGKRGTTAIALVGMSAMGGWSWFFHVFLERKGFVPGKMAFGLRSVDAATGEAMSEKQAFSRAILKLSPSHWGLRGAENDLENRASHDREAETAVIVVR